MNATQVAETSTSAKALPPLTAARLLSAALERTPSASIRQWAASQRPAWLKLARLWLAGLAGGAAFGNRPGLTLEEQILSFSAYIMATAMGL